MAKKSNTGKKAVLGAGLAAAAVAAAAGAYFLYGKDGAKHRRQVKSWSLKAKAEVLERLEGLKKVSEREYARTVNDVLKKYKKLKHVDAKELRTVARELKRHWGHIQRHVAKKPAARKLKRKKAAKRRKR